MSASGGATSVMVIGSDNHAHLQTVETGVHSESEVQIKSGVQPGQRVITSGAYGLADNTQVKVETPAESNETGAKPEKD